MERDPILPNRGVQSILDDLSFLSLQHHVLTVGAESQIGCGGYGEVLLAKLCESDQAPEVNVAVKCIWSVGTIGDRQRFIMRFARELKIWASIRHLNTHPLIGFRVSDNYQVAQLVSPYMANGNVTQYISRTNPGWDRRFALVHDIAAGVEFLHNHHPPICHGDLNPANVLVSDSHEATLCDFGLSSLIDASGASSGLTTSRSIKGSTRYMSPELLLENDGKHTLASDVWAWACTAFEIFTNLPPYSEAKKDSRIIMALIHNQVPGDVRLVVEAAHSDWLGCAGLPLYGRLQALISSISKCWSFSQAERPTMSMVVRRVFLKMDGIYPSHWRKAFGHVRVRIRSSARFRADLTKLAGPWIWLKLNGACHGIARFSGPGDEDGMQCADADIHVPVQSFREVIVLETYTSDGIKKLILGRIGILVRELACSASSSISRLQHYAIQESEGQLSVEYNLEFSHSEKKLDFGEFERYGQSFRPVMMLPTIPEDDSDTEIPATPHEVENFITAPRADLDGLGPVSWRVTTPIPKSRADLESVCSVSSEATTFVTARTHISADYISVPGGSRDFYRPQAF